MELTTQPQMQDATLSGPNLNAILKQGSTCSEKSIITSDQRVNQDQDQPQPLIWWSNSIFFVGVHLLAVYGVFYVSPLGKVSIYSLVLTFVLYRLSMLGITLGYHRLFSHRAFHAALGIRILVAIFGSMACQGSIKWWSLRHRLHHRFTDDPVHDPYAATKGLLFSHMGWIFLKPKYKRLDSVEKDDLDNDPVVRIQHKYYVQCALLFGFVVPTALGLIWGDVRGTFIWGSLVCRILTWHSTFLVNSFAHWDGFQRFSDETTAKGNLIMALFTCGEGNHNFHVMSFIKNKKRTTSNNSACREQHAFPYDFRAGPALNDWDPCKWIISTLSRFGLATRVRRADNEEIQYAMEYMKQKQQKQKPEDHGNDECTKSLEPSSQVEEWQGSIWSRTEAQNHVKASEKISCFLTIDDYFIDATQYMKEHPGGAKIFRPYSIRVKDEEVVWQDATWAFQNHNYHSLIAKRRLRQLAIAKILDQPRID